MTKFLFIAFGALAIYGEATSPALAQPKAPQLELRAGEIALAGQILALDGPKKQLTLSASRFTLPSGQSKAIAPAKARVATFPSGFTDAKSLQLGQNIILLGVSGVGAAPFKTRAIEFEKAGSASTPTEAPDPYTPPALAPILGNSQSAFGVKLRLVDAGFADNATIFSNDPYNTTPQTGFFTSVKIEAPRSKRTPQQIARFIGLQIEGGESPNASGAYFGASSFGGETRFWTNVGPTEKSATLTYEVLDPKAPEDAEGAFPFTFTFDDLELPAKDQTTTYTDKIFTTSRGSKIRLVSVKAENQSFSFVLDVEKAAGTPDIEMQFQNVRGVFDSGERVSGHVNPDWRKTTYSGSTYVSRGRWKPAVDGVKKTFSLTVRGRESALSWKKTAFFKTIDLPVSPAALFLAAPPAKRPFPVAPVKAESNSFSASIEPFPPGYNGWQGSLWLREKTPTGRTLRVQSIKYNLAGKPTQETGNYGDSSAFHLDNTPKSPDEFFSSLRIYLNDEDYSAASFDLKIDVVAEKINPQLHSLQNIILPAPGETKSYETLEIGNEILTLQSIRWVDKPEGEPDRIKNYVDGRSSLLIVFDIIKTKADAGLTLRTLTSKTNLGVSRLGGWSFSARNVLHEEGRGHTLRIDAPPVGAKTLGLNFQTQESDQNPTRETLEWKAVPLGKGPDRDF